MKALICNEFGSTKNLTLEEVKSPEPGAGQVLIDVHAAGINFPDCLLYTSPSPRDIPLSRMPSSA